MNQTLSKCLILFLLTGSFTPVKATATTMPLPVEQACAITSLDGVPIVDIVIGAHGNSYMSWTPFSSTGGYSVSVTDLTAFTLVTSFSTTGTSANITGLTSGHTYRYSVTDGIDFIIEDVVH